LVLVLTKAFHTPIAVPSSASSPIITGMEADRGIAYVESANELRMIGPRGCTLVRPMRAKTIT
jgi:hypothetical protein